jgi:hypothetical protein
MTANRLRLVIFQDAPGLWHARGLEHDLAAEGSTIGQAVRALARMMRVHADYDMRHHHPPLVAFPPSAQRYWNAFASGTAVPLTTLGVVPPEGWVFQAAFATRLPGEPQLRRGAQNSELRT